MATYCTVRELTGAIGSIGGYGERAIMDSELFKLELKERNWETTRLSTTFFSTAEISIMRA